MTKRTRSSGAVERGGGRIALLISRLWLPVGVIGTFATLFILAVRDLPLSASLYPTALAVVVWLFIVIVAVGEVRRVRSRSGRDTGAADAGDSARPHELRSALSVIIALSAYIYLLPVLGFLIDSTLFIAGLVALLGERRPLRIVLIAVAGGVVSHLLFVELFNVPLPSGMLS